MNPSLNGRALVFLAGCALIGFTALAGMTKPFYVSGSYYLLWCLVGAWVAVTVRYLLSSGLKPFFRRNWPVVALALLLTTIVFISVKPRLRVLADETNLVAASRTMFSEKKADEAHWVVKQYGEVRPLVRGIPLRPPLFPFLIHGVHVVRGYDYRNAFVLNAIVLFLVLSTIGCHLRRLSGRASAAAGMLLIAAQPVVSLTATSAHYDLFFSLLILLCGASLTVYLRRPSDRAFDLLWINLVMLAHVRHESFLYSAIAAAALAAFGKLRGKDVRSSWVFWLTPLLAAPVVWHALLTYAPLRSFVPTGTDPFSLAHFVRQNAGFLKNLFRFDYKLPYANAVSLAGLAAGAWLGWRIIKGRAWADPDKRALMTTAAAVLAVLWAVLTSVYWGNSAHPACARFYLMPSIALSLLAWAGWHSVPVLAARPRLLVALSVFAWVLYHPAAVRAGEDFTLGLWKENRYVSDFFNRWPNRDFLLVVDQAHKYCVYDYGAVNFAYANRHRNALLRQKKDSVFQQILVAQKISVTDSKPHPKSVLDASYRLRTVEEKAVAKNGYRIRISEVVDP